MPEKSKQARHIAKLKGDGWKQLAVWISPDASETVAKLKARWGSVNAGLEALGGLLDRIDAE